MRTVPLSAAWVGGGSGIPDTQVWTWTPDNGDDPSTSDETPGTSLFIWTPPEALRSTKLSPFVDECAFSRAVTIQDQAGDTFRSRLVAWPLPVLWVKHMIAAHSIAFSAAQNGFDHYECGAKLGTGWAQIHIDGQTYNVVTGTVYLALKTTSEDEAMMTQISGYITSPSGGDVLLPAMAVANPGAWATEGFSVDWRFNNL